MADVFNKIKRSDVMSRIRFSGNKDTELALICGTNSATGKSRVACASGAGLFFGFGSMS